jgi:hypothetical protein
LLIGVLAVALTAVLVTWAELILSSVRIGYLQLPPVSIGLLLLVLSVSRVLSRVLSKRFALGRQELVAIYIMCVVGAMVSSHGVVEKLLPLLVTPDYAANNSNNWRQLYFSHIKSWMVPWNPSGSEKQPVAVHYFEGIPRGGSVPWAQWLLPLAVWITLFLLVLFAFLCVTSILRRQWVDNEKLSFPLAQLPLEIIVSESDSRPFLTNPLVWCGALIPIVVYGIDWLHLFAPAMPVIPTSLSINDYLTTEPWKELDYMPLIFSYAAVGFFFLLPVDIIFSIWFFFVLARVQQYVALTFNMDQSTMPLFNMPLFLGYQTVGAYVALVVYLLIIAKPHLAKVWRCATFKERDSESDQEMMPYPVAVWGMIGSLLIAAGIMVAMGMSPWLAALDLCGLVFLIAIVMARSTAEAGMLMTETTFRPIDLYRMVGSLHALGPANLTVLAFVDNLFLRDQRGLLLTGMLDSARLADGSRMSRRSLVWAVVCGILVALAVAVPLQLYEAYTVHGGSMDWWMMIGSPETTFTSYAADFSPNTAPIAGAWQMPVFFAIGAAVTVFLTQMRATFFWWPLHPLGYALAGSWCTIQFWFPCLIAWIIKSLTVRYGGMKLYTAMRPFFMGLILGEFGMAVLTTTLNVLPCKIPVPPFPWQ